MANVFVSYARKDVDRVEALVSAFEAHGLTVWWDRSLEQGADFGLTIDNEIDACGAAIVCWTHESIRSQWVRGEASRADRRGKYVGVLWDDCLPPTPFNTIQTCTLTVWGGEADSVEFLKLLSEVGRKLQRHELVERVNIQAGLLERTDRARRHSEQAARLSEAQSKIALAEKTEAAAVSFHSDRADFAAAYGKLNAYRMAWAILVFLPLLMAFVVTSLLAAFQAAATPEVLWIVFAAAMLVGAPITFWLASVGAVSTERYVLPTSKSIYETLVMRYGSTDPKSWKSRG